ncbi:ABC transporter substrate-binding protein [Desmospora profundinema]|uniref:Sn-glycerol 3-phosphate transport system substrate-binding protein n=1 Tax=Desmospora profundinema TaxID=1571184 RepID=A0ABU1IIL3_9BACL|nr:sn-glycerol 3-phosphate transport system substrate-binding protein [Desmospora profundinema]
MRTFRKPWLIVAMITVMIFTTVACSAGSDDGVTTDGKMKVVWWHSMGGELKSAVDHLVKEFNESQSEVVVEAVYQGEYDESLNKLRASLGSNSGPTMVQVYEIGSRYMIDSNLITPIQTFVDKQNYDLSQLEENIIGYYTIDDQLNAMPFNTSNPILYYNKDQFKEAGLDPENPPTTFEEVAKAAEKLSDGKNKGASFALYGWFMEQFFANQGAELVNNGNGRDELATESLLGSEAGVQTLTWWKEMVDDGVALNLGRKTDDTKKAFTSGQVAMTLDSTASLRGIVDSVGDKFEVGTAFLPKPKEADEGGVIVGGASLYILNNRPETEQEAAWKFIEFLTAPEQQAYWHVNTGYFPITKTAYDEPAVKENLEKFPQFQTAVDQLHETTLNRATQGALMGVFPEARQITERAMEEVINGQKTPEKALEDAQKEITEKIEQYNSTVNR